MHMPAFYSIIYKTLPEAHMDVAESAAVLVLVVISLVIVIAILIGTLAFQLVELKNTARTQKDKKE